MSITQKLFLASILALSIAGSVRAQNPTQGDYYPFRDTGAAGDPSTGAIDKAGRLLRRSRYATEHAPAQCSQNVH